MIDFSFKELVFLELRCSNLHRAQALHLNKNRSRFSKA
jgi:hypothetical protein